MNSTRSRALLALTSGVVAVNALAGAAALVTGLLDLGDPITGRLPFHSPAFAAVALLAVVGVPMTAVVYFAHSERPYAPETAMVAGVLLVGWIVVQLVILRTFSWLQPTMALAGAAVFLSGVLVRAWSTPHP